MAQRRRKEGLAGGVDPVVDDGTGAGKRQASALAAPHRSEPPLRAEGNLAVGRVKLWFAALIEEVVWRVLLAT